MIEARKNLWLLGTGPHARAYVKVLSEMATEYEVIGRSEISASEFSTLTGKNVLSRDLTQSLKRIGAPDYAIVSVSFDQLAQVSIELIHAGVKNLLIEKPGGLNLQEITAIHSAASIHKTKVYIGYNRRFYEAAIYARRQIAAEGGALSCHFEFTEWASTIEDWNVSLDIKNHLLIANSSHVIDLAFFLCGKPKNMQSYHSGEISWHTRSARFAGSGETETGALFSYIADWQAPGRWGVEVMTRENRYIFRPMEQLHKVKLGSVTLESVTLDDAMDREFKPGLFRQTQAFLKDEIANICSLEEQVRMITIYSKMAGYSNSL